MSLLAIVTVIACSDNPEKPKEEKAQKTGVTDGKMKKATPGQILFKKNCTLCHGRNGKRGINGAKDLTKSTMSLEEKMDIIRNGKDKMTAFKHLGEEKIRLLAEYVESLE